MGIDDEKVMAAMEARIKELEAKAAEDYIVYQRKAQKQAKCIAELEAENARLKADLMGECELRITIENIRDELEAENERLHQANLDCNAHVETLNEDYDKLKAQVRCWRHIDGNRPAQEYFENHEDWVLVKIKEKDTGWENPLPHIAEFRYDRWNFQCDSFGLDYYTKNVIVTDWMPLPQPPTTE